MPSGIDVSRGFVPANSPPTGAGGIVAVQHDGPRAVIGEQFFPAAA
jgi:hypothetical protein